MNDWHEQRKAGALRRLRILMITGEEPKPAAHLGRLAMVSPALANGTCSDLFWYGGLRREWVDGLLHYAAGPNYDREVDRATRQSGQAKRGAP